APAAMLSHYATQLPAVEINNTFYRMPRTSVLEQWRTQVGEEFRFAIKASRRITHSKKLSDCSDEMGFLMGNLDVLGPTLGAVLFQLPPFLRKDRSRLADFIGTLRPQTPAAFEFRHGSWFDDEIATLLGDANLPWVVTDSDDGSLPEPLATADWGYLRLRRTDYDQQTLQQWRSKIEQANWSRVMVFFKHEDDCAGPALAQRFLALE
ncbi:MAG: DUF72 domain-containing protein, partial [Gammaproteobacteria bacterium]|nr:DUF72 domain-containing protein [Gammaproteobacteria bacterium]